MIRIGAKAGIKPEQYTKLCPEMLEKMSKNGIPEAAGILHLIFGSVSANFRRPRNTFFGNFVNKFERHAYRVLFLEIK
jgi:hypothetical protein